MLILSKSSPLARARLTRIRHAVVATVLCASVSAFAAAPANDNFNEAEAITHAMGSVTGTTANATRQADEPLANSTVWYRWTAPFTGAVHFEASASDSSIAIAGYQGDSLLTLDALALKSTSGNQTAAIEFNVIDGHVYRIQVGELDGLNTLSGPFALDWSRATGPGSFRLHTAFPIVPENAGTVSFTVERVPATGPASVRYVFLDRMARNGRDYIGVDGTLQFADGETTQSFTVQILDNDIVDSLESFVVKLEQPTGGSSLGFPSFSHVIIEDDDYPLNDRLAAATALVGSAGSVSASLAGATVEDGEPSAADGSAPRATLWYSFTAPTSGILICRLDDDFNGSPQIDTFTGATLATLAPVPNARLMADGGLATPVQAGTNYLIRVDGPTSRTTAITLNYLLAPGASLFEIADVGHLNEIRENGGARTVTVNRIGSLDSPASVRISAHGRGLAVSDVDFSPVDTVLSFGPNESSQAIAITALTDDALEGNERVRLQLTEPTGGAELSPDFGESIILNDQQDDPLNDDFAHAFSLDTNTTQLTSTNAGASRESGEPIHVLPRNRSVWFNYTAPKDGITTVSAHNDKFSALLAVYTGAAVDTLSPIGDDTDDSDEGPAVVRFRATTGTVYRIAVDDRDDRNEIIFDDSEDSDDADDGQGGGGGPFLLTYDTIAPGTLGFTLSNYVVSEGGGTALITITRASGSDGPVGVHYATANGTATAGRDYTATSGEAVFGPGETSASFGIPILDNTLFDGPRTVQLILSEPVGDANLDLINATLTIDDDDDFTPGKGSYSALALPGSFSNDATGLLSLKTNPRGRFSGTLLLGGKTFRFKGSFNGVGASTIDISRNGFSLILTLQVSEKHIFGTVTAGGIVSTIEGARNPFSKKGVHAPQAGTYTVLVPGDDENQETGIPKGDGFATMKIGVSGRGKLVGALADGAKFSTGVSLSVDGPAPIYAALYRKSGSLSGTLNFRSIKGMSDADGTLHIFKPPGVPRTKIYPSGFSIDLPILASRYAKPQDRRVLDGLDNTAGEAVLAFGEGNLAAELTQTVNVDIKSAIRVTEPRTIDLEARILTNSGILTGSFTSPAGLRTKFKGVIFQVQDRAGGFFRGQSANGYVRLAPATTDP